MRVEAARNTGCSRDVLGVKGPSKVAVGMGRSQCSGAYCRTEMRRIRVSEWEARTTMCAGM